MPRCVLRCRCVACNLQLRCHSRWCASVNQAWVLSLEGCRLQPAHGQWPKAWLSCSAAPQPVVWRSSDVRCILATSMSLPCIFGLIACRATQQLAAGGGHWPGRQCHCRRPAAAACGSEATVAAGLDSSSCWSSELAASHHDKQDLSLCT
jgi:hypothetical protein